VLVRSVRHARVEDEGRARLRVALPPIPASPEDAWLDGLDADLERALAELPEAHRRDALQRGWHGDLAPRRLPRRMVAIAVALLAVGAGVAAGASLLKSPAEEQTGFLAGTTLFRGSDVSCAAVGESAFRCTLPDTPTGETFGASPFPGMKVETVGIDRDVDGGCVSVSADGRVWDCYLGEEAVRRGIIGPGLLGAYSPGQAAA
jgi:hypothetical protein